MIDIEKEINKNFPKINSNKVLKKSIFKFAKKLIHQDDINSFLKQYSHLNGFEFVESVLEHFNFDFSYSNNDIDNIPSSGRVVIIANHPLGALDALCLLKLVSTIRKDVKIVANDFLSDLDPLKSLFINIDNFKSAQSKKSIQKIYDSLNNEEAIIIFPAGEVSRLSPTGIKDGPWQRGFLKFAQKTKSPILPIFVDAKNSKLFYTISILNKTFSTILLSDEMFKKEDKNITIKIGKTIAFEDTVPNNHDNKSVVELYKKHLYSLKKGKKHYFKTQNPIARSEDKKMLRKELKESQLLGQTSDGKKIYLYKYVEDSVILQEIGRLREISFRKVNEGVNKKRDLDKYDKYYEHIVLWDEDDLEIVGSYRIAVADDVYDEYGFKGLYTHSLFKFNKKALPYLENSIELGRSFIQPKYWGTRALDYLWYGIGAYLKNSPNIKYMYGPVTISGSYPQYAKELLVDFYGNYFGGKKNIVEPKEPFEFETKEIALNNIFSFKNYKEDFKNLKDSLQSMNVTIPTLYKQYSDLCKDDGVKFYGFNIDPDFSNCVDGFIMVEVSKIKESKKSRYMK
ncbi:MAG: lysophospholipid acyltransferase family protein [Campylobacterota bacterium]|nr:lysophospholipid acyltransferase family protein [Campylobacterota bacterium]